MHVAVQQVVAGLVLAGSTFAGVVGLDRLEEAHRTGETGPAPTEAVEAVADTTPGELSRAFRAAAARAMPAVVNVEVEAVREARVQVPAPFEGTPWEDLFERGTPSPSPRTGNGSGFIFRSDGYVLTNNHVVDGATRVTVVLQDRREFDAQVIGRDPNTDIAVLQIEADGLPTVELGDSDPITVGDWVVALGYPLHLGATATAGIISAKGKQIGILRRNDEAQAPLEHFIQTDAAINPGNSGGPLIDLDGRVVGVNSAIASPTGYYSGYGFAVPMNLARRVAEDLIRHGSVRRPKLGVGIADVDPADAEVYGLARPSGVEVVRVEEGGPADQAGIRLGDVIVAVDGTAVETGGDLMERLARLEPGDAVRLDLVRFGERMQVSVRLDRFEAAAGAVRERESDRRDAAALSGFRARDLTPDLARRMGLEPGTGVVISEVDPSGPAARAGVVAGAVIERANGTAVESVAELERMLGALDAGDVVSLVLRTGDGVRTIVNYRVRG